MPDEKYLHSYYTYYTFTATINQTTVSGNGSMRLRTNTPLNQNIHSMQNANCYISDLLREKYRYDTCDATIVNIIELLEQD